MSPLEVKTVEVMADYTSSGLWTPAQAGPFRHTMIDPTSLNLPEPIITELRLWIQEHDKNARAGKLDIQKFDKRGKQITHEIAAFLGPEYEVVYTPIEELSGCSHWLYVLKALPSILFGGGR